jgi:hypothetical protein
MSPEQIVANVTALFQALMAPGGTLAAIVGTIAYGYGKAADSPNACRWGKNSWLGAGVLFGGAAVIGLVQNLSGRVLG